MKLGSGSDLRDGSSYRGVTLLWVWPTQCDDSTVTIFMETIYTLHSTATENIPRGFIIYLLAMKDHWHSFKTSKYSGELSLLNPFDCVVRDEVHLTPESVSTWHSHSARPLATDDGQQVLLWYSLHCDNNGKHILTFYNQDHWEFNLLNSNLKVINFTLIHQHLNR